MTDIAKARELLACPFCGATPHHGLGKVQHCQLHGEPFQDFSIWCPKGHAKVTGRTEDRALEVWNTRAALARPEAVEDGLVGELRALLESLLLPWAYKDGPDYAEVHDYALRKVALTTEPKAIVAAVNALPTLLSRIAKAPVETGLECHGLDTPERVHFYEQDFYVLSNFSSFSVYWSGQRFDTSEALYHWLKFASGLGMFDGQRAAIAEEIRTARSAHDAYKIAQEHKDMRRDDWDDVKITFMRRILSEKARQHEYVRRKLLATGDRELVENSWRDDFWGWGPNRDGQNMLGKLWMEVREELRLGLTSPDRGE